MKALQFGDNNGKARTAKKIYIGVPTVKMTNLIPKINGASGWSVGTSSTAQKKYSAQTLLLTATTSDVEVTTNTTTDIPLIAGHKYYIRVEVFFSTSTTNRRTSVYWPIAEPYVWNSSGSWTINAGSWRALSIITNRGAAGFASGSYPFRIDFDNNKKSGQMWIDGVMVIDLTAAFGSGYEPSQSWCDANIPYFAGEDMVIIYDSGKSVARAVRAAYYGDPNGIARQVFPFVAGPSTGGDTVTVNYLGDVAGKATHEFITGSASMGNGELLTLKIKSITEGYVIGTLPTATMDGVAFDLSPYIEIDVTNTFSTIPTCKWLTIKNLPVTGNLVINVSEGEQGHYLNSGTAENGICSADPAFRKNNGSYRLAFTPNDGYVIPAYTNTRDAFESSWLIATDFNTGEELDKITNFLGRCAVSSSNGILYIQINAIYKDANWHVVFEKA